MDVLVSLFNSHLQFYQSTVLQFHQSSSKNPVKKYGFSLENKGFLSLTVKYAGQTYDVTQGANTVAFDFWNSTTFKPTKTDASFTQSVGGVVLISKP
ncbi:hypothetical protein BGX26_010951 [Mortierella sp. AD094]|nr:hypothetical protein BGX26_010951 [Mortierella sp. AD094]